MKRTTKPGSKDLHVESSSDDMVRRISEAAKKPVERRERRCLDADCLVPTGSTLLNLACSDNPHGGYGRGKLVNLIGDSSSGKTFLALTCLAEVASNDKFDHYDLVYDDAEHALEFDLSYLFGDKIRERVQFTGSHTIQDFKKALSKLADKRKSFVYVLDSFDNLTSEEELTRLAKDSEQGSYRTEKVRGLNELLRKICKDMEETDSLLIIVSQVRDVIGSHFPAKTRTGGKQLKHNSSHEIWMSITGKEYKRSVEVGVKTKVRLTKNKLTGKVGKGREVEFSIFYDYGVDDVGANIDYLLSQGHWDGGKGGSRIKAEDFEVELTRKRLIHHIEKNSLESELQRLVSSVYTEKEKGLQSKRKPRF